MLIDDVKLPPVVPVVAPPSPAVAAAKAKAVKKAPQIIADNSIASTIQQTAAQVRLVSIATIERAADSTYVNGLNRQRLKAYSLGIANFESGGFNPNAKTPINPKTGKRISTATGLNQILDKTAAGLIRDYGDKLNIAPGTPMTDIRANALLGVAFTKENHDHLRRLFPWLKISHVEMYAAHLSGPGNDECTTGASGLIQMALENPNDVPGTKKEYAKTAKNNPSIFGRPGAYLTVRDVFKRIDHVITSHMPRGTRHLFDGMGLFANVGWHAEPEEKLAYIQKLLPKEFQTPTGKTVDARRGPEYYAVEGKFIKFEFNELARKTVIESKDNNIFVVRIGDHGPDSSVFSALKAVSSITNHSNSFTALCLAAARHGLEQGDGNFAVLLKRYGFKQATQPLFEEFKGQFSVRKPPALSHHKHRPKRERHHRQRHGHSKTKHAVSMMEESVLGKDLNIKNSAAAIESVPVDSAKAIASSPMTVDVSAGVMIDKPQVPLEQQKGAISVTLDTVVDTLRQYGRTISAQLTAPRRSLKERWNDATYAAFGKIEGPAFVMERENTGKGRVVAGTDASQQVVAMQPKRVPMAVPSSTAFQI